LAIPLEPLVSCCTLAGDLLPNGLIQNTLLLSSDKVKRTTEKLKPNPRKALGKEEITGKLTSL